MEIMRTQKFNGKAWETTYETTDAARIHESLMHDLIAKKLEKCSYITSIRHTENYNGTATITVTYSGGVRTLYTVNSH